MPAFSIGDLAQTFHARQHQFQLKTDLQRLGTELTTGEKTDLLQATGGDLGALAGIDHALGTLKAHKVATDEAWLFSSAVQRVFETVQDTTSDLGPSLLQASSSQQATLIQTAAVDAKARFETVISALNTQVADRSVLAGVATGTPALADAETMLASLTTAIAGETTAAGVEAAVIAWFDTPAGGFETVGYTGSDTTLAPFRIGPLETAELSITAQDQEVRDTLKGYAMAALIADGALSGDHPERIALLETAATQLITSDRALAELRAAVGSIEARIDTAAARNEAEGTALELARNEIVAVDPYQTASELQQTQTQLETFYALTARLSRLSLAEYLR